MVGLFFVSSPTLQQSTGVTALYQTQPSALAIVMNASVNFFIEQGALSSFMTASKAPALVDRGLANFDFGSMDPLLMLKTAI